MNRLSRKMYGIISVFVIVYFMCFQFSQTAVALEETGVVQNAFTWSINDDMLTLQSSDGNWTAEYQNENCTVYGNKLVPSEVSFDDLFLSENKPLLQWFADHSIYNLDLKVKELYSCTGDDIYMQNINSLVIDETVEFISENAFIGTSNLKNISVFSKNIDLTHSGIGYYSEGETLEDVTIYGYSGSTSEKYANENGFNFIAFDEPISTTTTTTTTQINQTTSTSITSTTTIISSEDPQSTSTSTFAATTTVTSNNQTTTTSTSLPISTTSKIATTSGQTTTITSKGNSDSNENANKSKGSLATSPKTGDSFPLTGALTAIGILAASTILFAKKRK